MFRASAARTDAHTATDSNISSTPSDRYRNADQLYEERERERESASTKSVYANLDAGNVNL